MTKKKTPSPSRFTTEKLAEHKRDHALIEAVTNGDPMASRIAIKTALASTSTTAKRLSHVIRALDHS